MSANTTQRLESIGTYEIVERGNSFVQSVLYSLGHFQDLRSNAVQCRATTTIPFARQTQKYIVSVIISVPLYPFYSEERKVVSAMMEGQL